MKIGGRQYDEIVIMNEKGDVLDVIKDGDKAELRKQEKAGFIMGVMQYRAYATMSDYAWQLACLNDRLMNRAKYVAFGEDVDASITHLQRWIIEYDGCHPKRETVQAV